jgi:serine acetyltransferase
VALTFYKGMHTVRWHRHASSPLRRVVWKWLDPYFTVFARAATHRRASIGCRFFIDNRISAVICDGRRDAIASK